LISFGLLPAAQEKPNAQAPTQAEGKAAELAAEIVQAKLKKVEENKDLDAAVKTKLVEIYNKTLDQLRVVGEFNGRAAQKAKAVQDAPDALKALQAELARPPADAKPEISPDATLAQLQQVLSQAETQLAESQKNLTALQYEPKERADRRAEVPKLADAAKAQVQELEKQLEAKPAPEEDAEVTAAARALLVARRKAIEAEQAATQQELIYYEATGELLTARRDLAARRVAETEKLVKAWRDIVNERRRQDAERQAREAQRAAAQAHPAVRQLAHANAQLAKLRQELAAKIEHVSREFEATDKLVTGLDEQFKKITKRVETAGATEAIGLLLRKQRDELPKVGDHDRKIAARSAMIAGIQLELIDHEDDRAALANLEGRVEVVLQQLDASVSPDERAYVEAEVSELLKTKQSYLDSLLADTTSYLDKLVELDVRERQLIARVHEYAEYCDERILWIRSSSLPQLSDAGHFWHALVWFVSPAKWREVGAALADDAGHNPMLVLLFIAGFAVLVAAQRPFRRVMHQVGEEASKSYATLFLPTVRAVLLTVLLAVLWPGVMAYIGFRLALAEHSSDFAKAIGQGMQATALVFGTIELFRHVCRRRGLGEAHFGWPGTTMKLVRVTLWLFMVLGLPFILIVSVTESQSAESIKNTLGRLAFLGSLIALVVSGHRLLRPSRGLLDTVYAQAPNGWISRLRRVWHLTALGVPAALGMLAIAGYYYTALALAWRLLASLWLVLSLIVVHAVLLRWIVVGYRDLAIKRGRERRALAEAKSSGPAQVLAATGTSIADPMLEVKLSDVNRQARSILRLVLAAGSIVGLWLIWVNVLPALGVLRRIDLWTVSVAGSDGAMTTQAVTLANLVLAIIVAAVTFAASRNLPGLLEITVLRRLPLDPGGRYAISTLCKYAISVIGVVTAFGAIGIGWSKVQWLVAALGVGLGFGLQEIFANFVSGLIMLFERPVRVGDIVSVGDVTGTVSRIRMRATTILDWDMRELVVPNKEFITGRVMNWTLSSKVSRMTISVGVAFGTNPDRVRELLLQAAQQNPLVLKDPPPHALFDNFGDSTLSFVLRVYMASRDVFLQLRHELHTAIAGSFQEAGIEIAFPQRDIHIRSATAADHVFQIARGSGNGTAKLSQRPSSHE
jgi:potassium efflux system protein